MNKNNFTRKQSEYWDSYIKDIKILDLDNIVRAEKIEYNFLLSILGNIKNKTILDLGCGTGKFGLKLARKAKEVTGIDISRESILLTKRTAKKYSLRNYKGVIDDFKKPKYKDYFDIILMVNMIHHTNDLEVILQNVKKALKKNGKLVVFEINPLNLLFIPFLIYHGQIKSHINLEYWRSNIFSLKYILKREGYKIEKIRKWCMLPTALYNRSLVFKTINEELNKIPVINTFSAFHVITCSKQKC